MEREGASSTACGNCFKMYRRGPARRAARKSKEFQLKVSRMWKMCRLVAGEGNREGRSRQGVRRGSRRRERCLHNTQVNSLSITISGRASLLLELSQMEEVDEKASGCSLGSLHSVIKSRYRSRKKFKKRKAKESGGGVGGKRGKSSSS